MKLARPQKMFGVGLTLFLGFTFIGRDANHQVEPEGSENYSRSSDYGDQFFCRKPQIWCGLYGIMFHRCPSSNPVSQVPSSKLKKFPNSELAALLVHHNFCILKCLNTLRFLRKITPTKFSEYHGD